MGIDSTNLRAIRATHGHENASLVPAVQQNRGVDSGGFGGGVLRLDWKGVDALPGLAPQLVLKGELLARGYGIGAVAQVAAEVTAWRGIGAYTFLGATTPKSYVLNWVKQEFVRANPRPADESTWNVELHLPMSPMIIEGLEDFRQGSDLSLQVDTTVILVHRGQPLVGEDRSQRDFHPTRTAQDQIAVRQQDWARVLERWGCGMGISIVVPNTAIEPDHQRAEVVKHLRKARQKIDGGDYVGAFTEARMALEILRRIDLVQRPLPNNPKDRNVAQRVGAVVDALFGLASAPLHTELQVGDFVPRRADAVSVVAATASIAQRVFAALDAP